LELLTLEKGSKNFGGVQALNNVNFSIELGERRAIIGPNGAGKTTLFNVISGLLKPSSGRILFLSKDITRMPAHRRAALGLARTFQITNLFPSLTVKENTLLSLQAPNTLKFSFLRPLTSDKYLLPRAQGLLEQWGMWDKRDIEVRNLSYGDQRQLEIILALSQNPKLLLLDEPTSGLSPAESTTTVSMIEALHHDMTILFIEHDMDTAFRLAKQVMVLHLGRVLALGSPDEIKRNSQVQKVYLGGES
jgi:branched-chain amino acid transport system ATP-binding protein